MRVAIQGEAGQIIGVLEAEPKQFKTGSKGFYGTGKINNDGKRYQASVQLVEIGSKPSKPPKAGV